MTSKVRLAVPADAEELLAMCRRRHEETGLPGVPFDDEEVRSALSRGVCEGKDSSGTYAGHERPAWIGVIGDPGSMEGSAYVAMDPPWGYRKPILIEHWNYVLPEYRKSTNAQDLIAFSKGLADAIKVYPLLMTSTEAPKLRLYTRTVGAPFGATFLYGCGGST